MIPYVVKGQLDNVQKELENKIVNASSEPKSVTYDELVALVHSSKLIVGKEYRITDYCTTILEDDVTYESNMSPWKSAQHPFDIIVTAVAKDKLAVMAKAALHEGDEYFKYCHLDQWKLGYELECLTDSNNEYEIPGEDYISCSWGGPGLYVGEAFDGPSWMPHYYKWWFDGWNEFSYTDKKEPEVGDGVYGDDDLTQDERPEEPYNGNVMKYTHSKPFTGRIIYMKDERCNEASYDFKNIMCHKSYIISKDFFFRSLPSGLRDRYYYLFDCGMLEGKDASILYTDDIDIICHEFSGRVTDKDCKCYNNKILVGDDCFLPTRSYQYSDIGYITLAYEVPVSGTSIYKIKDVVIDRPLNSSANGNCNIAIVGVNNINNVHIGPEAYNILLRGTASSIDIGAKSYNIYFKGGLNGRFEVGDSSRNVKAYGYPNSYSKTTSQTSIIIGDNVDNIILGDDLTNCMVMGNVTIGHRCVDVTLPCSLWDVTIGSSCESISADAHNTANNFVYLQYVSLGNHCTDITFKLADARGNYYNNITLCDGVRYMTFEQDNTGKGVCQNTQVKNIFVAPGVESSCNTKDARFDPATSDTNINYGQTYFTLDANKDTIMYWYSSGITMAGKKWDKTNKVWVAL